MTPTQAQIDAALKAYSEAGAGHRGGMIAAITAAAEVGGAENDPRWMQIAGQGVQTEFQLRKEMLTLEAATIERCAQVAEKYCLYHSNNLAIAAAIRALATEGK